MTTLHFRYPEGLIPVPLMARSFFAGWGKVPFPSQVTFFDDILSVQSEASGSGTFFFPWPHKRLGFLFLATDTLCERERPYLLVKELARGQLGRIIRRFIEMVYFGFKPSAKLRAMIRYEVSQLAKAATSDENLPATELMASQQLERLILLCHYLVDAFIDQSLAFRQQVAKRFPVRVGLHADAFLTENSDEQFQMYSDNFADVFHLVNPTPPWKILEPEPDHYRWDIFEERIRMVKKRGFVPLAGPILPFDQRLLPPWLAGRLDEPGVFEHFAFKYLDTFLEHFAERVDVWILASRINTPDIPFHSPGQIMGMVKKISWVFERHGLHQPGLMGVDQPWGDYLLHRNPPHSPRTPTALAEILGSLPGIDGILLDLNLGLSPRASYPRDPMVLSSMIDQWSSFGKPLYLSLGIPSELGADPDIPEEFVGFSLNWSKKTQQEWLHRYLPVILCKRSIEGIFWNMLEDSTAHDFPNIGLFDSVGRLKPAFQKLVSLRRAYIDG
ncbi:MAG: hypothetical protein LBQ54_03270 [Planctomycetaceae bacterium]|jgi:hypothetical protein|nr:hypothetical protein [Planctomycetaceae bacterium]